jgi:hypothetical protein
MTTGPFLYDDDPAPLHTGVPRQRKGLLVALLGSTVLIAVLMVGGILFFKGSGEEQSREVATVFTAALSQGDVETAYDLLCDDERARVLPADLAGAYGERGTPTVVGARESEHDDAPAYLVDVRWEEGAATATTQLLLVPEGGTKVCGTSAG